MPFINMPSANKRRFNHRNRHRGFLMAELMIVLSVVAMFAVYAADKLRSDTDESLAVGSAAYLNTVVSAAHGQALLSFHEYSNGLPVPGFANPLNPQLAELRALGRLSGGFPIAPGSMPTRQNVNITVQPGATCPGINCEVRVLACTTTAMRIGTTGPVRFDLAATMVQSLKGNGAQSLQGNGGTVRGATMNTVNPQGNVEGIVCATSAIDTALYNQFVRMNETRDPNLQGPLTVAGPTTINNTLSVSGNTDVGTCAKIRAATGRAGFGCADPDNLPAGYTGGVRAPDVVANGRILASDNPAAFTGSNGNYAYVGVNGGVAEIRTSGRAAGDRLTPLGQYPNGAACAAADEGSIARRAGADGLVVCQGSVWRSLFTGANPGDPCSPDGSMATSGSGTSLLCVGGTWTGMDTLIKAGAPGQACAVNGATAVHTAGGNASLICRNGKLQRLQDVTTSLTYVRSVEVTHNNTIAKPNCLPAAGVAAVPVIFVTPKTFSAPTPGFFFYYEDNGTYWTVKMYDQSWGVLGGTPNARAMAEVYCYYP